MLNKIYDKIKFFIKENYKTLIFFLIFIIIFNIQLDYEIYSAGGLIDVSKRIEVENGNKPKGSLNLTYVTAKKGVLPFVILSYIVKGWDLVPLNESRIENESYEEIAERNKIYLKEGINNSIVSAFKEANKEYTIKNNKISVLYVSENSETDIKVGDEIISVEGEKINNTNDFASVINKLKTKDSLNIKVFRNKKQVNTISRLKEENGEKLIGIYLINLYDVDTKIKVNIDYKGNEGGSSGGLINSLYIYNSITKEDLIKNNIIAGTGTIDKEGNVGKIAGIKYKLLGAENHKANLFLVPNENYDEAKKIKDKYDLKIKLIKVSTLKEAINKLKDYNLTK